ncbi:hypothetical protein POX_d04917 [Penicillium oxalicum]|uniref:hypothetical protein n=1 Tax=Penicillium oxalicum TaxID=69781 RepID=UPI0020B8F57F|nr:hypothetical protein POX_d04917 [Penicillium oxalicum]KAI2789429.1 hypothetical protein POX_d04917 [Penicillium oxalicum]
MPVHRYTLFLLAPMQVVTGFLVPPPRGTAHPDTTTECSAWVSPSPGSTCASIEASKSLTADQFTAWNPFVIQSDGTCALVSGYDYCVQVNYGISPTSLADTTTAASPATDADANAPKGTGASSPATNLTANAVENPPSPSAANATTNASNSAAIPSTEDNHSPSPIEPGVISGCNSYHAVVSGDSCQSIAAEAHIDMADFVKWNPNVGPGCASLWLGYYVCTGVITQTTPEVIVDPVPSLTVPTPLAAAIAPSSTPVAASPPSPLQNGISNQCDHYYMVKAGDNCYSISAAEGVSLSDFYTWNPSVGNDCSNLWQGYYVCIGTAKAPAATPSTLRTMAQKGYPTPIMRRGV